MKTNWVAQLMHNYRITFLFIGLLLILGLFGFDKMAKAEFPDFVIRQGVIVAIYPGATAEEVEQQVAKPLERYLFTFDEVKRKKTTTTSSNGMCVCQVELQDHVNNKDEVWSKIRHGLNDFKSQSLPSGVLALVVNDNFGSASALLIAIESEERSPRELKLYSDNLADRLRRIESVSNVVSYGDLKEQLTIYIDQQRLAAYGIGRMAMIQALQSAGMTTTSGSISGTQKDIPIHVKPTLASEQEIENQIIYTDPHNHVVRVKDVATVKREYDRTDSYIEYNRHPSVLLSLEMMEGNNIVQYGKDVQKVLDNFVSEELPADVSISRIADQCKVVEGSVKDFMFNLLESMAIIVIVMLLLFPWRTAIVAGLTVPLSTFISIGFMYLLGIPLNTVTLAGLIIVLGMVVDNAIVVLDGYLEYLNKGMSRWHAAAESAQHYFMPMMLATLCITVIFFPFLFVMTGMTADFVEWLPWTILINLMVSLLLAVVVIPVLEFFMIKKRKKTVNKHVEVSKPTSRVGDVTEEDIREEPKKSVTDYVQTYYEKVLGWTFRHPWLTMGGAVVLIALSLVLAANLKVRMMPTAERDQFAVEITLPAGSGLAETQAIADSIIRVLEQDERTVSVTSFIGCASPRFHTAYAPKVAGRNYAQFIVNTISQEATVEMLDQYEPLYSEHFPNAFVKFKQLDFQNFNPFEYRFYGEDIDSLRAVGEQMVAEMRKNPNLMNVHADWENPRPLIEVELNPVATSQLGLNRTMTELQLSLSTGTTKVGQVWEDDYEVPIMLKDIRKEALDCDGVNDLYLSSVGATVSLRQMGDAHPAWGATHILHRGGERCLTVTCDLKRNVFPAPIHKELQRIATTQIHLPEGVRFELGGEPENDIEMGAPIAQGLIVAVIIIFFFILFNFKNYKLTLVCLAAIALCLPGAFLGLALMNRAIGITAVFGFITLMGMIMRNEILIFEHANGLVRKGWTVRDAAYDAGRRRMVPIFLTTATTAVGVVPMIVAATNFWMPVGVSIFAGGIGALIMVVTVLPVVYWKIFDKRK
ncbi:MAG: efflux RND transporter permease subunit [Bacteroidaceae bacterium]|nr:efflux RND transporter permease subunit [Bacteroidaceae bacterium]